MKNKGKCKMSTQKEKDLFYEYKYNKSEYLKQDIRQLQQQLRYRDIDVVDCIEMILALERLNSFNQVCKTMEIIFKVGDNNERF